MDHSPIFAAGNDAKRHSIAAGSSNIEISNSAALSRTVVNKGELHSFSSDIDASGITRGQARKPTGQAAAQGKTLWKRWVDVLHDRVHDPVEPLEASAKARAGLHARWTTLMKTYGTPIRQKPSIALLPLLALAVMIAVGVGLVTAKASSSAQAAHQADLALVATANATVDELFHTIFGVLAGLQNMVLMNPRVPDLLNHFNESSHNLLQAADLQGSVLQLEPFGVVRMAYPEVSADSWMIGYEFATPYEAVDGYYKENYLWASYEWMLNEKKSCFQLAYNAAMEAGIVTLLAPIFISNVTDDELFGNEKGPSYCADKRGRDPSNCYYPEMRTKWWGSVVYYAPIDKPYYDAPTGNTVELKFPELHRLKEQGLQYELAVLPTGSLAENAFLFGFQDGYALASSFGFSKTTRLYLDKSTLLPREHYNMFTSNMLPTGDTYELRAVRPGGNRPSWELPLLVIIPIVAVVISGLLFSWLLKQHQHAGLLRSMLPPDARQAIREGRPFSHMVQGATILYADISNYTKTSTHMKPHNIVGLVAGLHMRFDQLVARHKCFKGESVGDAYVVCAGAFPYCSPTEAAERAARLALDMLDAAESYQTQDGQRVAIRVGLHTGPVCACVLSEKTPRVAFIGDTISEALQMEATSAAKRCHVSMSTALQLMQRSKQLAGSDQQKGQGLVVDAVTKLQDAQALHGLEPGSFLRLQGIGMFLEAHGQQEIIKGKGSVPTFFLKRMEACGDIEIAKGATAPQMQM